MARILRRLLLHQHTGDKKARKANQFNRLRRAMQGVPRFDADQVLDRCATKLQKNAVCGLSYSGWWLFPARRNLASLAKQYDPGHAHQPKEMIHV
jgi:hypothetical protein